MNVPFSFFGDDMKFFPLLFLLNVLPAVSQSQPQLTHPPITAVRLTEPITIDGFLNESAWKQPGTTSFIQDEPNEGESPTQKTELWIAYDNDALYVGAYMYDTHPDEIVRVLSRRDVFNSDDWVGIGIDSYHDKRTGFYFTIAASGTKADGTISDDENLDGDWDGIWEGKAQIVSDGWTMEMRIPFSQLRFKEADEIVMGMNFVRDIGRNKEEDFLVYTPRNMSGFVSHFPDLIGIKGINTSRKIEVLPYVSSKAEYLNFKKGDPYNDGSLYSFEAGTDIKMGLGSNLTLDATFNPDFGQVEVDPAVVNLTDVENYFDEKRPFFIEGANIFNNFGRGGANSFYNFSFPQISVFYSRRIGRAPQGILPENEFNQHPIGTRILGAAKLTGKIFDDVTIGTIHAFTNKEIGDFKYFDSSNSLRDSSVSIEPYTYYGIVRSQKNFNDGFSSLGFLTTLTARKFDNESLENRLSSLSTFTGIDGYTFLDSEKLWIITGWTGITYVKGTEKRMVRLQTNSTHYFQQPDSRYLKVDSSMTSMTGFAGRFYLNKQKGNVIVNSSVAFVSPYFEINDVGFNSRTNVINLQQVVGYKWTDPTEYYRRLTATLGVNSSYDYDGNNTWIGIRNTYSVLFNNYYEFTYSMAFNPETKNITRTRGGPITINKFRKNFSLSASSDSREDFVMNAGYDYSGSILDYGYYWEFGIDWKPQENILFRISPAYSFTDDRIMFFDILDDPNAVATFGKQYLFSDFNYEEFSASIRLNWTFSPELSLEVFIQPLLANGKFSNIKSLTKPGTSDFNLLGTGLTTVSYSGDSIKVDIDGTGPLEAIDYGYSAFSRKSVIGNAVLRWEYLPGSTLFFVWTQTRNHDDIDNAFRFSQGFKDLMNSKPENVFIVKMSYWLPI